MVVNPFGARALAGIALASFANGALAQERPDRPVRPGEPHRHSGRRPWESASPAEREARRLLFRMVRADQRVGYAGREIVVAGGRTLEMQVRFDPKRGMRREAINPAGELIVDDLRKSWLVSPARRRVVEGDSMLQALLGRWRDLLRAPGDTVRTERQGEDTVAGRSAEILSVSPAMGASGPSRRFWIDKETGLRLRTEEKDADGRIVASAYFLSVTLSPPFSETDFTAPAIPPGFQSVRSRRRSFPTFDDAAKAGYTVPEAGWLPPGYRAQSVDVGDNGRWVSAHWGNGLTVVTVTVMRSESGMPMPVRALPDGAEPRMGDLPGGRKGLSWRRGDTAFLLIAPLSEEVQRRIADSVR